MEIKPGYYKTRDGRKARVLCVDANSTQPVAGYIEYDDGIILKQWTTNGRYVSSVVEMDFDLIESWTEPKPKKKITLRRGLVKYDDGTYTIFPHRTAQPNVYDAVFVKWLDEEPMVIEIEEDK